MYSTNESFNRKGVMAQAILDNIAVIIVTFNRKDMLCNLITMIKEQTRYDLISSIVVVDNASDDGTERMLRELHPDVCHLRLSSNTGAAGGFYHGLKYAHENGFDWYWLFNDDTKIGTTLLEDMERLIKQIYSVNLGFLKPQRCDGGQRSRMMWRGRHVKKSHVSDDAVVENDIVIFGAALMPRQVVNEVGFPLPEYFMMIEELDYCLRILDAGLKNYVYWTKEYEAYNLGSDSTGSSAWRSYYQSRNQVRLALCRKNAEEIFWCFWRQMKFMHGIITTPGQRINRIKYRLMGIRDGLIGRMGKTLDPVTGTYLKLNANEVQRG